MNVLNTGGWHIAEGPCAAVPCKLTHGAIVNGRIHSIDSIVTPLANSNATGIACIAHAIDGPGGSVPICLKVSGRNGSDVDPVYAIVAAIPYHHAVSSRSWTDKESCPACAIPGTLVKLLRACGIHPGNSIVSSIANIHVHAEVVAHIAHGQLMPAGFIMPDLVNIEIIARSIKPILSIAPSRSNVAVMDFNATR